MVAEREPPHQADLDPARQELKPWEEEVRFDREVTVRRLDEVTPSDAANLGRHRFLIGQVAEVLDHGVGEDDVELVVGELAEVASIACELSEGWRRRRALG